MDARGGFQLMEAILYYLGEVMKGNSVDGIKVREERKFYDIIEDAIEMYKNDNSKYTIKVPESEYIKSIPTKYKHANKDDAKNDDIKTDSDIVWNRNSSKICGNWFELTKENTSKLIQKCRDRKTTIQGVISAASAVSFMWRARELYKPPYNLLLCSPCQISNQVNPPISPTNCVCGSTGMCTVFHVQLHY